MLNLNMKYIWKDIPGYEGIYQISSKAEIRKILSDGNHRYLKVSYKKAAETILIL